MIEIRHLTGFPDYEKTIEIQHAVWGFATLEIIPSRVFHVARQVGGQAIGAFDGDRLIGFCFALPGVKRGETPSAYLHSHMLAVLPDYRDQGIGRRLKLAQRADALERGITLIEWTFDPLEIKNAHLNIERLGVIVRRYVPNQYGITSSHLHSGMPTDRLVAEWFLGHPRTIAILDGARSAEPPAEARITVPVTIQELRHTDVEAALAIQTQIRDEFERRFTSGLAVLGLERAGDRAEYLLGRWS